MGGKGLDFKHKEVINIVDGKRMGYVQDVCADLENGVITSIIVPGNNKLRNVFSGNNEIVIPWQNIKCIGEDVILVEIGTTEGLYKRDGEFWQKLYKKVILL